jgi:hypothetical protein
MVKYCIKNFLFARKEHSVAWSVNLEYFFHIWFSINPQIGINKKMLTVYGLLKERTLP